MASEVVLKLRNQLFVLGLAYAIAATGAAAQESEVRDFVEGTLAAWSSGDFQSFAEHYHPDARGFFLDGGNLIEGINVEGLQAGYDAGIRAELTLRDLDVQVYGETSVSVAYLDGSLTLPGGAVQPGTWRYTETRVRDGGTWRVVQYHFSEAAGSAR